MCGVIYLLRKSSPTKEKYGQTTKAHDCQLCCMACLLPNLVIMLLSLQCQRLPWRAVLAHPLHLVPEQRQTPEHRAIQPVPPEQVQHIHFLKSCSSCSTVDCWMIILFPNRSAVHPSEGRSVEIHVELLEKSHSGPCIL